MYKVRVKREYKFNFINTKPYCEIFMQVFSQTAGKEQELAAEQIPAGRVNVERIPRPRSRGSGAGRVARVPPLTRY